MKRKKREPPFDNFLGASFTPEQISRLSKFGLDKWDVWVNARYSVATRRLGIKAPFGQVIELSIKRRDRMPIFDWRDLQKIKDIFIGAEAEMVQIFPAESRHVDTSNQYYFFAFPYYKFPFGFRDRLISQDTAIGNVQRPFAAEHRHDDIGARDDEVSELHKLIQQEPE